MNGLKWIEQGKVDRAELTRAKDQNTDLLKRIAQKDVNIRGLNQHILTMEATVSNYNMQNANYVEMVRLLNQDKEYLQAALKKQKRKTTWTMIAGILVSGGLTYLLITK